MRAFQGLSIFFLFFGSLFGGQEFKFAGFFINAEPADLVSFERHIDQVDYFMPVWVRLQDGAGHLISIDPILESILMRKIRKEHIPVKVVPVLSNYDGEKWRSDFIKEFLDSPEKQKHLQSEMVAYLTRHHFTTLTLDLEEMPQESMEAYLLFIEKAAKKLHKHHFKLAICLESGTKWDYQRVGSLVDLVILMLYDEHGPTSSPGPISGVNWLEGEFLKHYKKIPGEKLIVGVGSYAYDWMEGGTAASLTVESALKIANEKGALIQIDPVSRNSTFAYIDDQAMRHEVWFVSASALKEQVQFLRKYPIQGAALWRFGSEDPDIWDFFGRFHLVN